MRKAIATAIDLFYFFFKDKWTEGTAENSPAVILCLTFHCYCAFKAFFSQLIFIVKAFLMTVLDTKIEAGGQIHSIKIMLSD